MKHPIALGVAVAALAVPVAAQPGFSEGREYRYPTRFDVTAPREVRQQPLVAPNTPQISQVPSVVPSDFQTRRTGAGVSASSINVTGRIIVVNSHDGAELVTLRSTNGTEFRVTTGSSFSMNQQAFRAEGFKEGRYLIRNLANQQIYYFVPLGT